MADVIRYDILAQEALRGVVRRVLEDVAKNGVPGDHHFYITFDTSAPSVRVSPRLREKYPEEMTIILQHQFWDLALTEHAFEVGLSFSGVAEMLYVPFASIVGFYDPSVQFGLKFEPLSDTDERKDITPAPVQTREPANPPDANVTAKGKVKPDAPGEIVQLDRFRKK